MVRVIVGVFVGKRLLENDGSCVGSLGIVGNAVVGNSVGRGGRVGSSVCGRAVGSVGSSVGREGNGRRLGYAVSGITVGIVGRAVFRLSGIDGYADETTSGTDGSSVRRVGIVSGMDPRIGLDGRSDGIAGIDGRVVLRSSTGTVGKTVEGIGGIESVGSIEGRYV